jgi:hypothetical protein
MQQTTTWIHKLRLHPYDKLEVGDIIVQNVSKRQYRIDEITFDDFVLLSLYQCPPENSTAH